MAQQGETRAAFAYAQKPRVMRHAVCGKEVDMIGGDIEIHFCPACLELDMQAVLALQAALTAFKASGLKMGYTPDFQELDDHHTPSVKLPSHIRAWTFYTEPESDDGAEFYAYVVLLADDSYQTFRDNN